MADHRTATLDSLVVPGSTVAVSDGAGMPRGAVLKELSLVASRAGGVRLLLGWCTAAPDGLDFGAFAEVRTIMGGYGLRTPINAGEVRYVPARFGTVPGLLREVFRPDVLVAPVAAGPDGYRFTTEVAWMPAAVAAGAIVAGIRCPDGSSSAAGHALPRERVVVLDVPYEGPAAITWPEPSAEQRAIAERVARLIPAGARLQVAPGGLASALPEALRTPVHIDTGVLTPAVMELERRGLLLGTPMSPYVVGTPELYAWAAGRPLLHPIEVTHDPVRLAADPPLVAVNTALQIDRDGQVNVESVRGANVAGIGGQPDYAFAAARSIGGLSVLAIPTGHRGKPTITDALDAPAATPAHDVDVVVTETGIADLRGLDRAERRAALTRLWDGATENGEDEP